MKELPHAARIRWKRRQASLDGFREGWQHYRVEPAQTVAGEPTGVSQPKATRFTIDGDEGLEEGLLKMCEEVSTGIHKIVPKGQLEAVVLGGGYGRGQGGVLSAQGGDKPYNDLEFYVFVRGNVVWQERVYRNELEELSKRLSAEAGLHVEFKVDSLEKLRQGPVSMFSYDLVSAHRVVFGSEETFAGCEKHLDAKKIPLSEATRLLFNRCSGLLMVREF